MSLVRIIPTLALIATLGFPLAGAAQQQQPAPASQPSPAVGASEPAPAAAPPARHHHGRRHREPFIHVLRALNLTPDQRRQVAAFRADEQHANLNADAPTRQANAMKMRAQIRSILTPEQKTQLAAQLHHQRKQAAGALPLPAPTPGAN